MKTLKLIALSAVAFVLLVSFSLAAQIAKADAPAAEFQGHVYTATSIDGVLVSNEALDKTLSLIPQAAH